MKRAQGLRVLPKTRAECVDAVRPCPFVSCRYHLLLDIGEDGRLLKSRDFDETNEDSIVEALRSMADTCALDVAARGGSSMRELGDLLGTTYQRIEQLQVRAAARVRDQGIDFEEREHPEDFYVHYSNMGANELAEITAELRARGRTKR